MPTDRDDTEDLYARSRLLMADAERLIADAKVARDTAADTVVHTRELVERRSRQKPSATTNATNG